MSSVGLGIRDKTEGFKEGLSDRREVSIGNKDCGGKLAVKKMKIKTLKRKEQIQVES